LTDTRFINSVGEVHLGAVVEVHETRQKIDVTEYVT